MAATRHWEQNKEATVYVGNLDERLAEPLLWELMTQVGPVINVHMPMDRVSRNHQGFGFVEFDTAESAEYATRVLSGVRLFGKPVRVNKASADRQRAADIGAELFVSSLDPQVDEKILFDTFSQFGRLVTAPSVVRDEHNASKGYGFVSFDSFEASDAALAAMQGQYLLNRQINVAYAYKKDGKGERHGDDAERTLAAEGKKHNVVPEIQPLPPAFLMQPGANGTAPPPSLAMPMGVPGFGAPGMPSMPSMPSMPPMITNGANALPLGIPLAAPSAPPGFGPPVGRGYQGQGQSQGQGQGQGQGRSRGAHGASDGAPSGLPMAPSGLPQRPAGNGYRGGSSMPPPGLPPNPPGFRR